MSSGLTQSSCRAPRSAWPTTCRRPRPRGLLRLASVKPREFLVHQKTVVLHQCKRSSLPLLTGAAVTGGLASAGRLLTWQPAVGPAFCLFEAKMHHQHVRQRTRIQEGNGKDTPTVQGLPTMVRAVPIIMPELKQQKQKLGKATGSRNDDSVSRRCHRCILLGQGPCALAKCFASTETRRHDVGRAASAQSSPSRSGLRCSAQAQQAWPSAFSDIALPFSRRT